MTEQPQIPSSVPRPVEVQPAPVAAAPAPEAPRVVLGDGTDVTGELTKMREAAHEAVAAQRVVLEDGNDVTDGIEPDGEEGEKKPRMKRRDLLAVSAMLRRNKLDPTDPTAMGIGISYLEEKRAGETMLSFKAWLDEDLPEPEADEDNEDELDEDGDPTQP